MTRSMPITDIGSTASAQLGQSRLPLIIAGSHRHLDIASMSSSSSPIGVSYFHHRTFIKAREAVENSRSTDY
jgi:hypothetical protein